jgi:hypothetical protein
MPAGLQWHQLDREGQGRVRGQGGLSDSPCWRFSLAREGGVRWTAAGLPNPILSLFLAAVATSEVFRERFHEDTVFQPTSGLDGNLLVGESDEPGISGDLDFGGQTIAWVGCGSVSSAALYALDFVRNVRGKFHMVDPSKLNRSNCAKYLGIPEGSVGKSKADVLCRVIRRRGLRADPYSMSLNEYCRRVTWTIPLAICAADSSVVRRDLQAKLPRTILNGWTRGGQESLVAGVSRHPFDGVAECLNCAYWEDVEGRINLAEVAGRIGTDSRSLFRRLREGAPFPHHGTSGPARDTRFLDEYFNACDGARIGRGSIRREFSIPFISAAAGALLALAIYMEGKSPTGAGFLRSMRVQYSMAPGFSAIVREPSRARESCICRDPVYSAVYRKRWTPGPGAPGLPPSTTS